METSDTQFKYKVRSILRLNVAYWVLVAGWIPIGIGSFLIMEIKVTILIILPYFVTLNLFGYYLRHAKCPRCSEGFFLADSDFWKFSMIPFRCRCQSCQLSMGKWKQTIYLCLSIVAAVLIFAATWLILKFQNMESEYRTAQAIEDLSEHIHSHHGKWPESPSDLGGKYPVNGNVHVDYEMTSARLIESPTLLRNAVRPRSGKFYTYPHYEEKIRDLHKSLWEMNRNKP